jgi:hypothetical protein
MAITPDIALELTDDQLITIADVQAEVDLYLANEYSDGRSVEVRHALLAPLFAYEEKVLDAFVLMYQAAGWTVVRYPDKRQGDWLSFSRT